MTRINCVPAKELTREHLIAEYRELPRLFGMMKKYQDKGMVPADITIPKEYCLGTGHMKFFVNKGSWLFARQLQLISEMQFRGYKPTFTDPSQLLTGIKVHWLKNWNPSDCDIKINRQRINQRLKESREAKYDTNDKRRF